ncbi:MAG: transglutaminase-like domain-containing protein, partial [bacterium]
KEFKQTEEFLKEKKLPDKILQRHYDFVKQYNENYKKLKEGIEGAKKGKTKELKEFLEKAQYKEKRRPLDPNKLPHRLAEPIFKKPKAGIEEFKKGIRLAQATNQPTPSDLAETIEVQFTPEIKAKAKELGYNPVRIYNWARNNIEFIPTYGSIQGADMCLQTKQGNAFDIASLLIALLRVSNIPARYVYGTIEIPIEKVMNWVGGFTDPNAALTLIASGGIPVTGITSGGKIIRARMEHIWTEVYIPYGNYRGTMQDDSIKTWIPLDGSFKQYTYKEPIDFLQATGFNIQEFINEVQRASTITDSSVSNVPQDLIFQRFKEYVENVHQYYDTHLQNKTTEDVIGVKRVVIKEYPYLLGSPPYKIVAIGSRYSQIPSSLQWQIKFKVFSNPYSSNPDFSYTAPTPFLGEKSITLSYSPSTPNDESLIKTYGYIEKVPPYLLNLTPKLIIEGNVVATGIPVGSGKDIDFIMTFTSPSGMQDVVSNKEITGAYLGIGLDLNWMSKSLIDKKIAKLNQIFQLPTPSPAQKIQESLDLLASLYFAELDAINSMKARFAKVVNLKHPSVGIVGEDLKIGYLWEVPYKLSFAGLFIDVDRDVYSTIAKDGDKNKAIAFTINSGYDGSSLEHSLWTQIYNLPAVSAVKIHQLSNEMGIPIYKIDKTNLSSILPLLQISPDAKSDITNAVNSGKIAYVPQKNIQYYNWKGTAYIVIDQDTGAGGYIISGGMAGGSIALLLDCLEALIQLVDLIPLYKIPDIVRIVIEFLAFFATLHDIFQASAPQPNKGATTVFTVSSLILGLIPILFLPGAPIVTGYVAIMEVVLYVSIFYLLEGKLPVIQEDPLKACWELLKK